MWTRLNTLEFSKKTIPWVFVLVTILAYGLLSPWLGFYWDDWVFVWLLEHNGPVELARSFLPYDPLVSPFFLISSSIFGTHPFAWQLFGLAVRVLVSLAALWTFNQMWPRHPRRALWAALLFLVYPGYGQQWVAFTHANQEWISFGFFILSLGLTARSLRDPRKRWTVFALLTQFVGLGTTEYFLGMEFLRPVMIWFLLDQPTTGRRLAGMLKHWAVYIPIWLLAGVGQYLFHNSSLYGGHSFGSEVSGGGLSPALFLTFIKDIIPTLRTAAFDAWARTFDLVTSPLVSVTDWLTLAIILLSLAAMVVYLRGLQIEKNGNTRKDSWAIQAIVLGLVGILGGRIPSFIAGMPLELRFDWDRLLISVLFGVSLLTAGLIDYLLKDDRRKEVFLSLIIALAIGMQFQQSNTFRRDWENQKSFFWQLAWRAPALKPGTALVTDELPLQYVADLQLSAPLNLMYEPDATRLSYMLLYTKNRLGGSLLPSLAPDQAMKYRYRTVGFDGNTSNMIIIHQPGDGCLHVLDPRYGTEEAYPGLPENLARNIVNSNINQVEQNGDNMAVPNRYFGPEPARDWCYYFEKAELARQYDNWEEVLANYDSASSAGFTAKQPVENLVFLEGFARLGKTDQAGRLTRQVLTQDRQLCKVLLSTWQRAMEASPEIQAEAMKQIDDLSVLPECK